MADEPTEPNNTTEPDPDPEPEPTPEPEPDPQQLPDDHPVLVTLRKEREARKQAEAKIAEAEKAAMSEQERAIAEAREQARNEAQSEFATERLADRIRVAAAKKLNDPEDAVRLLDLDAFDASSDSLASEIEAQLGSLIESKPYLAVTSETPSGSTDAGSRTPPSKPGQLSRTDLSNMTPEDIDAARKDGRLDELMGVKS